MDNKNNLNPYRELMEAARDAILAGCKELAQMYYDKAFELVSRVPKKTNLAPAYVAQCGDELSQVSITKNHNVETINRDGARVYPEPSSSKPIEKNSEAYYQSLGYSLYDVDEIDERALKKAEKIAARIRAKENKKNNKRVDK